MTNETPEPQPPEVAPGIADPAIPPGGGTPAGGPNQPPSGTNAPTAGQNSQPSSRGDNPPENAVQRTRAWTGLWVVIGGDVAIALAAIWGVIEVSGGNGSGSPIVAILTSAFTAIGTMTTAYFGIKSASNTAQSYRPQPGTGPQDGGGPGNAGQGNAGQGNAGPGNAGQGNAGQGNAGQGNG